MKRIVLIIIFTCSFFVTAQQSDFETIDFQKADAIAERYQGEDLHNLPVLTLRLTAQLKTDVEKFRVIYYWVTHNIEGDYALTEESLYQLEKLYDKPESLARWFNTFRKEVFQKLKNDKKTLCSGYAYLIKDMANLAGLKCEVISGYGKINSKKLKDLQYPNHAWNAVQLDGKWYVCDATWSSGITNSYTYEFQFKYDNTFFLQDPIEFAKTHKPLDAKWSLLSELE